jgi:ferric-dicitrate binding protein FerR (iron transport regulator)
MRKYKKSGYKVRVMQKGNVLVIYSLKMKSNKIQNILVKYLSNQATFEELDALDNWIKNPENEKLFQSYIRTNYAIDYNLKKFNSDKIKLMLSEKIAKEKKVFRIKKIRQRILYGAAASLVIGLLATGFFLNSNRFTSPEVNTPIVVNTPIKVGTDKATLTLEDGTVVALQKGNNYQTKTTHSNGEQIVYDAGNRNSTKTAYHYLTIPRGGQFYLVLSDGTKVWLNSETQLKYPVAFTDGVTRQIQLVYGEAYFEVSPSTKHKGAKFKVLNKSQEVEVLGTHFNIKAYRDETNVYTTLVEGKVVVSNSKFNKILKPNEQASLNLQDNSITIAPIDVYNEISWIDGVFSFRKKPLGEIMKVLSRWYDIEVQFENQDTKNVRFNGVLGKEQKIEDILKRIKKFKAINDYEIVNKKIILK